jgi:hypothetical protein
MTKIIITTVVAGQRLGFLEGRQRYLARQLLERRPRPNRSGAAAPGNLRPFLRRETVTHDSGAGYD